MIFRLIAYLKKELSGGGDRSNKRLPETFSTSTDGQEGAISRSDRKSAGLGGDVAVETAGFIDLPSFSLEASVPAEEFFEHTSGELVSGTFVAISNANMSFIEAEWELEENFQHENTHNGIKDSAIAVPLSGLRTSIKRIRTEAERHRVLSPKSALALARLETGKTRLTASDVNALKYLLGRMRDNEKIAKDIEVIYCNIQHDR